MQEQSVMEIIKWFIGLMMIMAMVSIGLFCVQLQDINTFKQQVNYQILTNSSNLCFLSPHYQSEFFKSLF